MVAGVRTRQALRGHRLHHGAAVLTRAGPWHACWIRRWWRRSGLGKTANFVVLMARLFVDGKDHGPHPFLVQIRNVSDHQPLPGIEVGDIGPKFGFMAVDNGFLRFGTSWDRS